MTRQKFFENKIIALGNGYTDVSFLEKLRSEISEEERYILIKELVGLATFSAELYQVLKIRWENIVSRIEIEQIQAKELVKMTVIQALHDFHLPRVNFSAEDIRQVNSQMTVLFDVAASAGISQTYLDAYNSLKTILGDKKFEPVEKCLNSWLLILDKQRVETNRVAESLEILLDILSENISSPAVLLEV